MMSRALVLCGPALTVASVKPHRSGREHGSRNRALSVNLDSSCLGVSAAKTSLYFLGCQTLVHISHGGTKRSFAVCNGVVPGVPPPSGPPSDSWKWILGMVLTFVVPFLTTKWGKFLLIKNEIETAVQTVENVVDAVEKVAEDVEEMAGNLADDLPNGRLKNALKRVEKVADQIDDGSEMIGDLIDKVQEVEDRVDSVIDSTARAKNSLKEVKFELDRKNKVKIEEQN